MSDLISRQAVIDILKKNVSKDIEEVVIMDKHIKLIESVPTAYNVDAVIDKLENIYEWNDKKKKECYEERDWEEFYSYSRINEAFYIAIETVKTGGAE